MRIKLKSFLCLLILEEYMCTFMSSATSIDTYPDTAVTINFNSSSILYNLAIFKKTIRESIALYNDILITVYLYYSNSSQYTQYMEIINIIIEASGENKEMLKEHHNKITSGIKSYMDFGLHCFTWTEKVNPLYHLVSIVSLMIIDDQNKDTQKYVKLCTDTKLEQTKAPEQSKFNEIDRLLVIKNNEQTYQLNRDITKSLFQVDYNVDSKHLVVSFAHPCILIMFWSIIGLQFQECILKKVRSIELILNTEIHPDVNSMITISEQFIMNMLTSLKRMNISLDYKAVPLIDTFIKNNNNFVAYSHVNILGIQYGLFNIYQSKDEEEYDSRALKALYKPSDVNTYNLRHSLVPYGRKQKGTHYDCKEYCPIEIRNQYIKGEIYITIQNYCDSKFELSYNDVIDIINRLGDYKKTIMSLSDNTYNIYLLVVESNLVPKYTRKFTSCSTEPPINYKHPECFMSLFVRLYNHIVLRIVDSNRIKEELIMLPMKNPRYKIDTEHSGEDLDGINILKISDPINTSTVTIYKSVKKGITRNGKVDPTISYTMLIYTLLPSNGISNPNQLHKPNNKESLYRITSIITIKYTSSNRISIDEEHSDLYDPSEHTKYNRFRIYNALYGTMRAIYRVYK
ncbi:hypothetical protein NEOKW01_0740 [Nematocida sp. AWRm80]|nr:hypothetical protein NEOKW01_0740 [Nematocida sp. AWRm80]